MATAAVSAEGRWTEPWVILGPGHRGLGFGDFGGLGPRVLGVWVFRVFGLWGFDVLRLRGLGIRVFGV